MTPSPAGATPGCPQCRQPSVSRIEFIVGDVEWFECVDCGHVWNQPQASRVKADLRTNRRPKAAS
jgi:uncharacterized metal-binding protein (TIGR02443 family)